MRLYHTKEVSNIYNLDIGTVKYRVKRLDITPIKVDTERGYFYTKNQIDLILNFTPRRNPTLKKNLYGKNKIEIVEFFKTNKSNATKTISEKFNVETKVVERALSEYLKDRTVIIESKMNK